MKFTNELRGVKSRLLLFSVLLLIPVMMFAQSITVKGTVLDSAGEAVIGASVVEKGNPSNGTITDFDGKFTLAVSKGKKNCYFFCRLRNARSGCGYRKRTDNYAAR